MEHMREVHGYVTVSDAELYSAINASLTPAQLKRRRFVRSQSRPYSLRQIKDQQSEGKYGWKTDGFKLSQGWRK